MAADDPTSDFMIVQDIAASTAKCKAFAMGTIMSCYKRAEKRPAATCVLWRRPAKPVGTKRKEPSTAAATERSTICN